MTATLSDVLRALGDAERHGEDVEVVDATHDSRQAATGWLFCAIPGAKHDGHDHARDAVQRGASALLVERWLDLPVPQVRVPSVRTVVGEVANVVHGRPSERLAVVGVTGTNGKTTIAYLLEAAAAAAGRGTGVIGTIEARINGEREQGVRTTPEGTDLQRLLARMEGRGADFVAMEVSSHGLDLRRVDGTHFTAVAFTNLSQDHLDWHGSMEAYFAAKARLFGQGFADRGIVVTDDRWGRRLEEQAAIPVTTVGRRQDADVRIVDERSHITGSAARLVWDDDEVEVATNLPGDFNLTNAVVAVVAATEAGVPRDAAIAGVAACPGAPGRLERVRPDHPIRVFVDYAHSPDAVRSVLETLRGSLEPGARLLLVLGAGGDRDRGKRAGMGAAATLADVAVLTSDNPRSEDPEAILDALVAGAEQAPTQPGHEVLREVDRHRAIGLAVERARPGDVVLVAGKGHETTQEVADRVVAAGYLDATGGRS